MARIIVTNLTKEENKLVKSLKEFFVNPNLPNSKVLLNAGYSLLDMKAKLEREKAERLKEKQILKKSLADMERSRNEYLDKYQQIQKNVISIVSALEGCEKDIQKSKERLSKYAKNGAKEMKELEKVRSKTVIDLI